MNRKKVFFAMRGVFLTALGVILAAALLFPAAGCERHDPEESAEAFLAAWAAGDYSAMYDLLDESSREIFDRQYFTGRYSGIAERIGLLSLECSLVEELESDGERASFSFEAVYDTYTVGKVPISNTINLTRNGRDRRSPWMIEWRPELIFPDLTGDRRVGLTREEPRRGSILDRYRRPLAETRTFYEVGAVPGRYDDEVELVSAIASLLDISPASLEARLNQPWVREGFYVPLKVLAPEQEALKDMLLEIPGVMLDRVERRYYPGGHLLSHVIGYLSEINTEELALWREKGYRAGDYIGRAGLEAALEDSMRGSFGFTLSILEPDGTVVSVIASREAGDGKDIYLTIDIDLQQASETELAGKQGAVVALDPSTGDLLALASSPSFDPNLFVGGITSENWRALQDNPHRPLVNRALAGLYPPGSAFKPFTAAAALEEGKIDPLETVRIEGESWQPSEAWGGYRVKRVFTGQVEVDLDAAMKYSDNIYFARAGLALGSSLFDAYGERFGFGEAVPFILPAAVSNLSRAGVDTEVLLADSSFGQGEIMLTPLQMALLFCPFAAEGDIPLPRLILDGPAGTWKGNVISAGTASVVHESLVKTINDPDAPARGGSIAGFFAAGKTGTAETGAVEGNICWYVTYGPAEKPGLIVVVMVEGGGWASADALPHGRNILEYYLTAGPKD